MKLTMGQPRLLQLLTAVTKAVAANTPHAVLTGILLECMNKAVAVAAYNMELGIRHTLHCDDDELCIQEEGRIVIPGKQLVDVVRKLDRELVTIEVTHDLRVRLQSRSFSCQFHGLPAEQFPSMPRTDDSSRVTLEARVLKAAAKQVAFAAAQRDSRPMLAGIHLELRSQNLYLSATDAHRLAKRRLSYVECSSHSLSAIIPAKTLQEIANILADDSDPIALYVTRSHCLIDAGDLQFVARLIEGTYMDTDRLIPVAYSSELVVSKDELIAALARALVFSSQQREVQMVTHDTSLTISAGTPESGDLQDVLRITGRTESGFRIAFNVKNVLEALHACKGAEVKLKFTAANQPFVISPRIDTDLVHVISPVVRR